MRFSRLGNIAASLFGNKNDEQVIVELRTLVTIVRKCSAKMKPGLSMSLRDIVADEREADKAHQRFTAEIERAYLLRRTLDNKPTTTSLGHQLDDMIDGMRDVAQHIDTYRKFLSVLPDGSTRLIEIIENMAELLVRLVSQLANGHIDLSAIIPLVEDISKLEREADEIKNKAQKAFVDAEDPGDYREYLAKSGLIHILETITDHAKHCATTIRSMAQQE